MPAIASPRRTTTRRPSGRPAALTWYPSSASGWTSPVFNAQVTARKARHLDRNPYVAMTVAGQECDFEIEGDAQAELQAIAAAFPRKCSWWNLQVEHGSFVAAGDVERRVFGENPASVFGENPASVLGFGKASGYRATRWRFAPSMAAATIRQSHS